MSVDLEQLLNDYLAERAELADMLVGLSRAEWGVETPAPGWTVAHQVAHLTYFDEALAEAIVDPEAFAGRRAAADSDPRFGELVIGPYVELAPADLLMRWKVSGEAARVALGVVDPASRVPWFGPAMSVASKISARIMETWAHGQDVADALLVTREASPRLRHVVQLAVRARPYSYLVQERVMPTEPLAVRLVGPGGEEWSLLDRDADSVIEGSALDFCLVLTRRRHVDDTDLRSTAGAAREWLEIGQAFAGDPGAGRLSGQFRRTLPKHD